MNKQVLEFTADQQRQICEYERMLDSILSMLIIDDYKGLQFTNNERYLDIYCAIEKLKKNENDKRV